MSLKELEQMYGFKKLICYLFNIAADINKYIAVPIISHIEATRGTLLVVGSFFSFTNKKGRHNPIKLPITTTNIIEIDTAKAIINPPLKTAINDTAMLIVMPSTTDTNASFPSIKSQSVFFTSPTDKLLIIRVED